MRSRARCGSRFRPLSSRRRPDLASGARGFARELSATLNGTVTDGLRLSVAMEPGGRAVVGNRVSRNRLIGDPVALTVSRAPARVELSILHTLVLDERGRFLTTDKSHYVLQLADSEESIVTYDYTRNAPNEYPEAHLHLHGGVPAIEEMLKRCGRRKDKCDDLHFPVGGRRFRPCLEDLIEFCILERLVTPRESWRSVLDESRDRFRERQLRAAVRRFPTVAADVLVSEGWTLTPPDG